MSLIDIKISPKDIAEKIKLAGGWDDIGENSTSSFYGRHTAHRFHILPETVESLLESKGKNDFALSKMKRRFELMDYPTVEVKSYNCKQMLEFLIDTLCGIGSAIGGMFSSKPGPNGANDSSDAKDSRTISERLAQFVKEFPEMLMTKFGDAIIGFADMVQSIPDLYYRKMPELFAFKIPGTTVNNVYELPLANVDKVVSVNGDFGWSGDGILSKMLDFARGFINIPFQPFFTPDERGSGNYPSITVKFALFNDTLEHAMDNYKFIHTIIPWNMWVQWGLYTMPPVIYEIRPSCGMKLKWCTAKMNVSFHGAMREVSPGWTDIAGDIVTIPDVYIVTCTFTSLLDSNFNQYLLSFDNIEDVGKAIAPTDMTALQRKAERIKQSREEARQQQEVDEAAAEEAAIMEGSGFDGTDVFG